IPTTMHLLQTPSIWFLCGSQHLYGPGPLRTVAQTAQAVAKAIDASARVPLPVVFKGLLTTPEEIRATLLAANGDAGCAGVILWMHPFSPSRMWIGGLPALQKPLLHLHTQFNREAPWDRIDMDFMNLNQAAHGDREAGFMHTRLRLRPKAVSGPGRAAGAGSRTRACPCAARSSSATGATPRCRSGSARGRGWRGRGTTCRAPRW